MKSQGSEVIGLIGPLGAGKTVFVKGLAQGLGIADNTVSSPTFPIMNLYPGRLPLCHIDLYRLDQPLETVGLEEYLNWNGVTAIEWADKMQINEINMVIELHPIEENQRTVTIRVNPDLLNLAQFSFWNPACHPL